MSEMEKFRQHRLGKQSNFLSRKIDEATGDILVNPNGTKL
jgi:hypothetical protein